MIPATPANALKYDSRLLAICNHCAHTVDLGLAGLVKKFGCDYPVPALETKLKCTRCGSDSCAVQLALPKDRFQSPNVSVCGRQFSSQKHYLSLEYSQPNSTKG